MSTAGPLALLVAMNHREIVEIFPRNHIASVSMIVIASALASLISFPCSRPLLDQFAPIAPLIMALNDFAMPLLGRDICSCTIGYSSAELV